MCTLAFGKSFSFALILFIVALDKTSSQGICTGMTPCYCKFENGQFLDISALERLDGIPRFINITDKAEYEYSWNPCFNFTEGACQEVAICGLRPAFPTDELFPLGYQSTATFSIDSNNTVQLTYTTEGDGSSPIRKAHISLICDTQSVQNMTLQAIGQLYQKSEDYYFRLYSPLCCPQGTPNKPTTDYLPTTSRPSSLSTSDILLICAGFVIAGLLVTLTLAILKIKGKLWKETKYDNL